MILPIGTMGTMVCEINLTDILNKSNDAKLIRKVTRIYHIFNEHLNDISFIGNKSFRKRIVGWLLRDAIKLIDTSNFPVEVNTHLKCVVIAHCREYKRRIK